MGRSILAAVVGYLTMFVVVFVGLSVGFVALGTEATFQPGGYDVTARWLAVWFLVSFGAAVLGGLVCSAVARAGSRAVIGLAVVVAALGLLEAGATLASKPGTPLERGDDVAIFEAMMNASQPAWVALLTPVLGVIGVLLGGRVLRKRTPITDADASLRPS